MFKLGRKTLTTDKLIEAIAIDGPAASGKTTVGKMLADQLGFLLLDTGCMYRADTWVVLRDGLNPVDERAVTEFNSFMRKPYA